MQPISRITERSLEHITGTSFFIDDKTGQRWGIRTFSLRHTTYFNDIFYKAWATYGGRLPLILQHLAWALFIQRCLMSHDPFLPLPVRVRRVMGLPDYSPRQVWRLSALRAAPDSAAGVTIYALPLIVEPIIYATLEYPTLADMFDKLNEEAAKARERAEARRRGERVDEPKYDSWGEIAASYFVNKNMIPDALLDLTIPLLNSLAEYSKKEKLRESLNDARREVAGVVDEIRGRNAGRGRGAVRQ